MEKERPLVKKFPQTFRAKDVIFAAALDLQAPADLPEGTVWEQAKEPIRKTRLMRVVEEKTGRQLAELLTDLYILKKLSTVEIKEILEISDTTVNCWLRSCTIPVRSRREAFKLAWSNQTKKEERVKKIHAPAAKRQRSASLKRGFEEDPNRRAIQNINVRRANAGKQKKAEQRMVNILGDDPKAALKRIIKEEGLTNIEIATRLRTKGHTVSVDQVAKWKKKLGVAEKGHATRVRKDNKEDVALARLTGIILDLNDEQQEILEARYSQRGKPVALEVFAKDHGITRQVAYAREKGALQALRRRYKTRTLY